MASFFFGQIKIDLKKLTVLVDPHQPWFLSIPYEIGILTRFMEIGWANEHVTNTLTTDRKLSQSNGTAKTSINFQMVCRLFVHLFEVIYWCKLKCVAMQIEIVSKLQKCFGIGNLETSWVKCESAILVKLPNFNQLEILSNSFFWRKLQFRKSHYKIGNNIFAK